MYRNTAPVLTIAAILAMLAACSQNDTGDGNFVYPETATVEHVDVYHGNEVADPYS